MVQVRLLKGFDPNENTLNGMALSHSKTYFDGFHKLDPPYKSP